jgi:hypothetical protein
MVVMFGEKLRHLAVLEEPDEQREHPRGDERQADARAVSEVEADTCCISRRKRLNFATTKPRAERAMAVRIQAKRVWSAASCCRASTRGAPGVVVSFT